MGMPPPGMRPPPPGMRGEWTLDPRCLLPAFGLGEKTPLPLLQGCERWFHGDPLVCSVLCRPSASRHAPTQALSPAVKGSLPVKAPGGGGGELLVVNVSSVF